MNQKEMMRVKGYIPATEAARRTGVSVATIYNLLEAKRLEGVDVGSRHYVLAKSLVEYLGPQAAGLLGLV